MVNIAKRMRALKPIISTRSGRGAALLPPSPAPQLVNVHLQFPLGPGDQSVRGALNFWRKDLRRLKYHNPALPITVQHERGTISSPMLLTLQFEHEKPEVLQALPGSVKSRKFESLAKALKRKEKDAEYKDITEEEKEILARQQSPNFRDAPKPAAPPSSQEEKSEPVPEPQPEQEFNSEESAAELTSETSIPPMADEASSDAVQLKEKKGSGRRMYVRKISMMIKARTATEIWDFFEERTKPQHVPITEDDVKELKQLDRFKTRATLDRGLVKAGMDAMRREKADLEKARGEAERMKAEAM